MTADRITETVEGPKRSAERQAKSSVMRSIRQIPDYLRLLFGMIRDSRVSAIDRALVVGAILYVISPLDVIPDMIPFFGQVDDVFLVVLTLTRLFERARREVILDHWSGDPGDLSPRSLRRLLRAAALFLPLRARRRIRALADR
ncbi:MAG: YkvA family protein [Gemmatimonadaceae bacterium]